jgi:hypothetical protein
MVIVNIECEMVEMVTTYNENVNTDCGLKIFTNKRRGVDGNK